MLKIRSFLQLIKDRKMNRTENLFRRYSRHMTATVYAMSVVLLGFSFGNLTGFQINTAEFIADAAVYKESYSGGEETQTPGAVASDKTEYALNSPDTNILSYTTETVDVMATDIKTNISNSEQDPLSISPKAVNINGIAASMAILANRNDLFLTNDIINDQIDLFGLTQQVDSETKLVLNVDETTDTKDSFVQKEATEKTTVNEAVNETAKISIPASLTLKTNKAMKKKLSKKELEVLWRIVEAEATGEDIYGKILVANVVLNRVNDDEFPDTVSKVVFQRTGSVYQFSPTKDGRYYSVKITESTKEAVSRALKGEDYSDGALYFFARKLTSKKKASWFDNSLKKVVQYGCHEFYANK